MDFGQVLTTIISSAILCVCGLIYQKMKKRWKMQDNIESLYRIKTDCIIDGLKGMTGEIGERFTECYDSAFTERVKDRDFIAKE